jgi:uncharacterized FlaG/YvyC family protein
MSTDFSIKPVGAPVAAPIVHPIGKAAEKAVATELPASKSVTAADAGTSARNNSDVVKASLSNQVIIDREAASIVYRVVDDRTSLVVRQFPDESRLRLRAYLRAMDEAKREHSRIKLDQTA